MACAVHAALMLRSGPLPCRGLSGPTLYTNINVGKGTNALYSGGPSRSGANAAAGTTWWFIQRQGRGVPFARLLDVLILRAVQH